MSEDGGNPYIRKRKTQKEKGPIIARLPHHYFKDGGEMERELLPYEACIAHMKNSRPEGFEEHVALVCKDGDGKVYSLGMVQHHGLLKDTKENQDAIKNLAQTSVPKNDSGQTDGEDSQNQTNESSET
jgi:hypothetical protein